MNVGTDAGNPMERGSGQESHPGRPTKPDPNAGDISNRPLTEEERLEKELPPRGTSKR